MRRTNDVRPIDPMAAFLGMIVGAGIVGGIIYYAYELEYQHCKNLLRGELADKEDSTP